MSMAVDMSSENVKTLDGAYLPVYLSTEKGGGGGGAIRNRRHTNQSKRTSGKLHVPWTVQWEAI